MQQSPDASESSTIRPALIYGLIIAVGLCFGGGYTLMPKSTHFRMFNDERSFNFVMSHEVQPGTALNDLQQRLGPGTVPDELQRQKLIKATRDFVQQTPDAYPDGVELDDQFIGYEIGSNVHYLQFRSGRIVNFDPREYDDSFGLKATAR